MLSATAVLLALTLAGKLNTAASFDPVQNFPRALSFDDQHGKGFEWNKRLPCGANRATLTVKFHNAYQSQKSLQAPVAKVWLHSGQTGDASEQWVAAVVKAPTDTWKLNALAWLEKVTGSKSETVGGYGPADLGVPLQIDLAWTRDGIVSVKFGDLFMKQAKMDKPITGIGLGGSWSKFEFIDVRVGRAGDPDPACPDSAIASSSQISDRLATTTNTKADSSGQQDKQGKDFAARVAARINSYLPAGTSRTATADNGSVAASGTGR